MPSELVTVVLSALSGGALGEIVRRVVPSTDKTAEIRQQAATEQADEAKRFRVELREEVRELRVEVKGLYKENREMAEHHLQHREQCFDETQTLKTQVAMLLAMAGESDLAKGSASSNGKVRKTNTKTQKA